MRQRRNPPMGLNAWQALQMLEMTGQISPDDSQAVRALLWKGIQPPDKASPALFKVYLAQLDPPTNSLH